MSQSHNDGANSSQTSPSPASTTVSTKAMTEDELDLNFNFPLMFDYNEAHDMCPLLEDTKSPINVCLQLLHNWLALKEYILVRSSYWDGHKAVADILTYMDQAASTHAVILNPLKFKRYIESNFSATNVTCLNFILTLLSKLALEANYIDKPRDPITNEELAALPVASTHLEHHHLRREHVFNNWFACKLESQFEASGQCQCGEKVLDWKYEMAIVLDPAMMQPTNLLSGTVTLAKLIQSKCFKIDTVKCKKCSSIVPASSLSSSISLLPDKPDKDEIDKSSFLMINLARTGTSIRVGIDLAIEIVANNEKQNYRLNMAVCNSNGKQSLLLYDSSVQSFTSILDSTIKKIDAAEALNLLADYGEIFLYERVRAVESNSSE